MKYTAGKVAQLVRCLPCECEDPSSILIIDSYMSVAVIGFPDKKQLCRERGPLGLMVSEGIQYIMARKTLCQRCEADWAVRKQSDISTSSEKLVSAIKVLQFIICQSLLSGLRHLKQHF